MGKVLGPISLEDWITMKMIRSDTNQMTSINTGGKYDLAIRCNTNCLKKWYKEIWENAA